jgi:hypothetical protein
MGRTAARTPCVSSCGSRRSRTPEARRHRPGSRLPLENQISKNSVKAPFRLVKIGVPNILIFGILQPPYIRDFVDGYAGPMRQLTLRGWLELCS